MSDNGSENGAVDEIQDEEIQGDDIQDKEVDKDPDVIRDLGTQQQENERFQKYRKDIIYPPGHQRTDFGDDYQEIIEQPPAVIKTAFQTILTTGNILFAANGPDIHSFNIIDGSHLSSWKYPKEKNYPPLPVNVPKTVINPNKFDWQYEEGEEIKAKKGAKNTDNPPAKRRRTAAKKPDGGAEEEVKFAEPNANGNDMEVKDPDQEILDAADSASADKDEITDEVDEVHPRPLNPEDWDAALVSKKEPKLDSEGEVVPSEDEEPSEHEKQDSATSRVGKSVAKPVKKPVEQPLDPARVIADASQRPPDVAPEGWVVDKQHWRRPEFRPGHRVAWKHPQPKEPSDIPMVVRMSATADGKHVVAITNIDKTIWTFEHDGKGHLSLLSERAMPKRPVAIAFCYNDQIILAADKFGDVYGLPLIPGKHGSRKMTAGVPSGSATPATGQGYTPKADESTVHTIRNKKALANQKKQAAKNGSTTPAKEPAADFFHKLLLGHVSMLTDITVGRLEYRDPDSGKTRTREWIITADRDEHIRTSRNMPQAHIIENFLLGHKEFVSRVHIPEMHPNILISGGGDSYLFVWNYVTGELLAKCEMRHELVKEFDFDAAAEPPLAVSGIVSYYDKDIDRTRVFVICENIPKMFAFYLDNKNILTRIKDLPHESGIHLTGNPLSIAAFNTGKSQGIIVSYDPGASGTEFYPGVQPHFIHVFEPKGMDQYTPGQEIIEASTLVDQVPFTFRGELERALFIVEPLRKNTYDRIRGQKDQAGYWASNTDAG